LQILLKPVQDRPTFVFEIIQRMGAKGLVQVISKHSIENGIAETSFFCIMKK
jgi:hypothetical protein